MAIEIVNPWTGQVDYRYAMMDGAAIALARDNDLPVIVFSIDEPGNLRKLLNGQARATVIGPTI